MVCESLSIVTLDSLCKSSFKLVILIFVRRVLVLVPTEVSNIFPAHFSGIP